MLTAAVSAVAGMIGGLLPEVMKEVRDTRNASREREFLKLQTELQLQVAKANGDSRLREIETHALAQEAQAFREHMTAMVEAQARPTGIWWVDAMNALMRPIIVYLMQALFMIVAVPFTLAVTWQMWTGALSPEQAAQVIFGSLIGEAILAMFGFVFGYRSTIKKA